MLNLRIFFFKHRAFLFLFYQQIVWIITSLCQIATPKRTIAM